MDPLSVSASLVTLLQTSVAVVKYMRSLKDVNKDISALLQEVISVCGLLFNLKGIVTEAVSEDDGTLSTLHSLGGHEGPLWQLQKTLEDLSAILHPKNGIKQAGRALAWHFKKNDVRNFLGKIERHKTILTLALQNDHIGLTRHIAQDLEFKREDTWQAKIDISTVRQYQEDEQRRKIIGWLSSIDVSANHNAARNKHESTTGDWLVKSQDFERWLKQADGFVWLYVFAGCGKSVLCSTVIDHTLLFIESNKPSTLAYFYFDFRENQKQTVCSLLYTLVAQLLQTPDPIPESVVEFYSRYEAQSPPSIVHVAIELLFSVLGSPGHKYIVVDALDECRERDELLDVLSQIRSMQTRDSGKIHVLVTSRQDREFEQGLECITTEMINLGGSKINQDIATHVRTQITTNPKLKKWPERIRLEIEQRLVEGADGMFRWVFCQLNILMMCRKESTLMDSLEQLPKDLDETYDRILLGIAEEDFHEAFAALQWLAYSERPLSVKELAEAAIIGPNNYPRDERDRFLDPYDIVAICSGLVTLSMGYTDDRTKYRQRLLLNHTQSLSEVVSFAHFSVKEYIISKRCLLGSATKFYIPAAESHLFISSTCLSYLLSLGDVERLPKNPESIYPLIHYAAFNWFKHARAIDSHPAYAVKTTELALKHFGAQDHAFSHWARVFGLVGDDNGFPTPLYISSMLLLVHLTKTLLANGADVNERGGVNGTALDVATSASVFYRELQSMQTGIGMLNSRLEILKLLLDFGAKVEGDGEGASAADVPPLHGLVYMGLVAETMLLLERGADPNSRASWGGTPLHSAAIRAEEMIPLLTKYGADVNLKAHDELAHYGTPLHAAVSGVSSLSLIKTLLEAGAAVEIRDAGGDTPLLTAARNLRRWPSRIDHMITLLNCGSDVNARTSTGRSALHIYASFPPHDERSLFEKETILLLLDHGADIDARDDEGNTALSLAVAHGGRCIVELLLERGADASVKDNKGLTPKDIASSNGHSAITDVLTNHIAKLANDLESET